VNDFVHVGFHKSGSTWLQGDVFISSRRELICADDDLNRQILYHMLFAENDHYNRNMVSAFIDRFPSVLMSNESFSGAIWEGSQHRDRSADRLLDVLRDPGVLIVVRAQPSFIASLYAQYVREGGSQSFKKFLYVSCPGLDFDPSHLIYPELIRKYTERFGADRVLVLPYELITRNRQDFLRRISAFSDDSLEALRSGRRNASPSFRRVQLFSWWNRLFCVTRFNPNPVVVHLPGRSRVMNVILNRGSRGRSMEEALGPMAAAFAERYRESNRELQKLMPEFPLEQWGYPS
jgi:hypothetical protein